jgi:hypothetical protein
MKAEHPLFLVHSVNVDGVCLALDEYERRDTVVNPIAALRYQQLEAPGMDAYVSNYGTVVIVQEFGVAADEREARARYENDELFDARYEAALRWARELSPRELSDLDFSFVWLAGSSRKVTWDFVVLEDRPANRAVLIEAVILFGLTKLVDKVISELPGARRRGTVDPNLEGYTQDLFSSLRPENYLTNAREIDLMKAFYDSWGLEGSIRLLRERFDQATSSYSFYWEHAERRRDVVLNLLLGVVAIVGLLQADRQLGELLDIPRRTVDWAIVATAAVMIVFALYRVALAGRVEEYRSGRKTRELRKRLEAARPKSDSPER